MKRLGNFRTLVGILILASCVCLTTAQARMTTVVGAQGAAAATEDWTPASFRVYEGGDNITSGNIKLLLYDGTTGALVAASGATAYTQGNAVRTVAVAGSPTNIVAGRAYYFAVSISADYWSIRTSKSSDWGIDTQGAAGAYASPPSITVPPSGGDANEAGVRCVWVANAAGQRLVGWSMTASADDAIISGGFVDRIGVFCDSANAESSPVTP